MKQASLFDGYASLAGAIPAIKAAMREAAKAPGCDGRKALPDMMNELAVLAFCAAARNAEPLRVMLRCVGMDIMTEEDRKLAEYARTLIQQKKMKRQLRKLEDEL